MCIKYNKNKCFRVDVTIALKINNFTFNNSSQDNKSIELG